LTSRIYVARAIDGRDKCSTAVAITRARAEFKLPRFDVIDPATTTCAESAWGYAELVNAELRILATCDLILADMSLVDHSYIGCVAELVYAHMWNLPAAVYAGRNLELADRPWLRYHCDHIDSSWEGIVAWVQQRLP